MYSVLPPIGMLNLRANDDIRNRAARPSVSGSPENLSLTRPCHGYHDKITNTKSASSRAGASELVLTDGHDMNSPCEDVNFGSQNENRSLSPTAELISPRLNRSSSVSSQKYSFENQLTFAPKLNAFSLKLAQSRTSITKRIKVGQESRTAALQEEMLQNFTFKPSISENSCKIAERLKTDFWERQRQHTEKQKKLVDTAPSTWHPKAKASHLLRQSVPSTEEISDKAQAKKIPSSVSDQGIHTSKGTQQTAVQKFQENNPYAKSVDSLILKQRKAKQNASVNASVRFESLRLRAIQKLENRQEKIADKMYESGTCNAKEDPSSDAPDNVVLDNVRKHLRTRSNPLSRASPPTSRLPESKNAHRRSKTMPASSNRIHKPVSTIDPDRFYRTRQAAEQALKNKKVFICIGPYPTLRQSLRKRGWVEKYFKTDIAYKQTSERKNDDNDDDSDDNNLSDDDNGDKDNDDDDGDQINEPDIQRDTVESKRTASDDTRVVESEEASKGKLQNIINEVTYGHGANKKSHKKGDKLKSDRHSNHFYKSTMEDGFESDGQYCIMSRIARNTVPTFIWTCKRDDIDFKFLRKDQIVNHFARAVSFTTKFGLCVNLRNLPWFEPINSDAFFPRCHRLSSDMERLDFIDDYRMTSAMSILKWVVFRHEEGQDSSAENDQSPESPRSMTRKKTGGVVSSRALMLAMRACQGFLSFKEHADIEENSDGEICGLSEESWNQVLEYFYQVVHGGAVIVNAAVYVEECKKILTRIKDHFPQMDVDGLRNIWIIKPGAKSRGRGITIMDRLDNILRLVSSNVVTKENRLVVQKYIERPLLIYNTKFDIRQWFLVTDWNPLTIWFYRVCYLRFCSQEYTLDKFDPQYHLSNNSIQKHYENGTRSGLLPEDNMWSSEDFQQYLKDRGHGDVWTDLIYPGMKQAITYALESCQDSLEYRKNSFELYGADFMLSEDMKPWLIEINCSPAMGASTAITERLCAQVIDDTLKVVLDRRENKNCETGYFELAYKQAQISIPAYIGNNLVVEGEGFKKPVTSNNVLTQQYSTGRIVRLSKPREVKQGPKEINTNEQPQPPPKTAPEKLWRTERITQGNKEGLTETKVELKLSEALTKELNHRSTTRRGSWSGCLCGKGKKCNTASGYQLKSAHIEIPLANFQHFSRRTILERAKVEGFTVPPRLAKHVLKNDKPQKKKKRHTTKTAVRYQETPGRRPLLSLGPGFGVKQM